MARPPEGSETVETTIEETVNEVMRKKTEARLQESALRGKRKLEA